jgi:hypothetical protein
MVMVSKPSIFHIDGRRLAERESCGVVACEMKLRRVAIQIEGGVDMVLERGLRFGTQHGGETGGQ